MSHQTDIDDDLAFENMLFGGEDRSPPPSATDASQSQRFPFEAERSGEGAKAAAMDVPGSGAQNASVASSANGSYTGSSAPRIRIRSRGKRDMRRDVSSGDCRELFFSGLKTEEAHQEMAPLLRQLKVNGGLAKVHSEPHQDFGYLTFESPEKLRSAMVELDGKKVANCTLSVNKVAQVCPGQDYRIIQQFGKPSCNVVLRNAPYELCEESLLQALAEIEGLPKVVDVQLRKTKEGLFSGMAFVRFDSVQSASLACPLLAEAKISGRDLRVEFKKSEQPSSKKETPVAQDRDREIRSQLSSFKESSVQQFSFPMGLSPAERKIAYKHTHDLGLKPHFNAGVLTVTRQDRGGRSRAGSQPIHAGADDSSPRARAATFSHAPPVRLGSSSALRSGPGGRTVPDKGTQPGRARSRSHRHLPTSAVPPTSTSLSSSAHGSRRAPFQLASSHSGQNRTEQTGFSRQPMGPDGTRGFNQPRTVVGFNASRGRAQRQRATTIAVLPDKDQRKPASPDAKIPTCADAQPGHSAQGRELSPKTAAHAEQCSVQTVQTSPAAVKVAL